MLLSARLRSARSTPSPSRPGIVRSSVIASGRSRSHSASASSPSRALPTTSTPTLVSERVTMLRIRALSSTTTTRAGVVVDIFGVLWFEGSGRECDVRPGEDRARLEQHDQAGVDLGDRVDQRRVRAGRFLHLLV